MSGSGRRKKRAPDIDSGWSKYSEEKKKDILEKNPDLSKRELYATLSQMWNMEPYEARLAYSRKEKRHNRRKNASDDSDSDSDSVFDNEKLKKHVSSHSVFVSEKQRELRETQPDLTLIERTKLINMQWKELSFSDKLIYENKAKCINRKIDKESTDSDEEKYVITKHPKKQETKFDTFIDEYSTKESEFDDL